MPSLRDSRSSVHAHPAGNWRAFGGAGSSGGALARQCPICASRSILPLDDLQQVASIRVHPAHVLPAEPVRGAAPGAGLTAALGMAPSTGIAQIDSIDARKTCSCLRPLTLFRITPRMERFGSSFWHPSTIAAARAGHLGRIHHQQTGACQSFGQHRAAVRSRRIETVEQPAIGFDDVDSLGQRHAARKTDRVPSGPMR